MAARAAGRLFLVAAGLAAALAVSWSAGEVPPGGAPVVGETVQDAGSPAPLRVPRSTEPIRIDGTIDEAAWAGALVLELGIEFDPADNRPASPERLRYQEALTKLEKAAKERKLTADEWADQGAILALGIVMAFRLTRRPVSGPPPPAAPRRPD